MTRERFKVEGTTDVFDADGTTVIGRISAGTLYEGERADEHWLLLRSPDGAPGYIRTTDVVVVESAAAPPPTEPAATEVPSRRRLPRGVLAGLLVVAVAAGAVAITMAVADSDEDTRSVLTPLRELATGRPFFPDLEERVTARDLPADLSCELAAPESGVVSYEGALDVIDFFAGASDATVRCNILRLDVRDGDVADIRGMFVVEDFPSQVDVDNGRQVGVRCRSDVANTFSLSSERVVDGRGEISVAVDLYQTLGTPESPDVTCSERLGSSYRMVWISPVEISGDSVILEFAHEGRSVGAPVTLRVQG